MRIPTTEKLDRSSISVVGSCVPHNKNLHEYGFTWLDVLVVNNLSYNTYMKLLVTHRSPDLDALASVWMLRRFDARNYADSKLYFVNAGESVDLRTAADLGFSPEDITHTDTGKGQFDHHQEERGKLRVCATSLVYDYVCHIHPELKTDKALSFMSEYVTQIDHFEESNWEHATDLLYQCMIHNLIDGARRSGLTDDEAIARFGFTCLDAAYSGIAEQLEAQQEIEIKRQEFMTPWGKAMAIESANDEVIKFAQKSGYVVVVRKDPHVGNIRIKAVPGKNIDLTAIYEKVKAQDTVGHWYFHPAKTMLLNGSGKAVNHKPSPLTIPEIIHFFTNL